MSFIIPLTGTLYATNNTASTAIVPATTTTDSSFNIYRTLTSNCIGYTIRYDYYTTTASNLLTTGETTINYLNKQPIGSTGAPTVQIPGAGVWLICVQAVFASSVSSCQTRLSIAVAKNTSALTTTNFNNRHGIYTNTIASRTVSHGRTLSPANNVIGVFKSTDTASPDYLYIIGQTAETSTRNCTCTVYVTKLG
jgi:hypothetical protein